MLKVQTKIRKVKVQLIRHKLKSPGAQSGTSKGPGAQSGTSKGPGAQSGKKITQ
ncbi:hypothetical protein HYD47_03780 [Mycoplasmopsis bovis]|nr:hypothetical protein [Mycoplasmopsis bovis]QQH78075.1 hypothetical protein HYD47_03780 [Mycoplasmopsis bovis]